MTTDWTVDKISELADNTIEIGQTIVQSEKNRKSCIDHYIVGQYERHPIYRELISEGEKNI